MKDEIKFIKYNGIEGYIELMKHDVEPLNNSDCKRIDLYYDGKDIKAVLDYITNLQEENKDYKSRIEKASEFIRFIAFNSERPLTITELNKVYNILQGVGKE